jgi:PAS domain S-box-containing protein
MNNGRDRAAAAIELFGILADQSPNMIFVHNFRSIRYVNRCCAEVTGYTAEELCAPSFDLFAIIAPRDRELVAQKLGSHRDGLEVGPYAYRLITRDGREVDVVNSTRLIEYNGERAILGVVTDVSEIRRTQKALARSEARHRTLIELLPDGVAVTDLTGRLLMGNQRLATMLGHDSVEELRESPAPPIERVSPEQRERALREAEGLAQRSGVAVAEATLLRRDGSPLAVEIAHAVLTDDEGRPEGFIRVLRDITVRREAEELERRMLQAQKLESLGLLAGGIAHDFNNLLMGVLGNASLALRLLPEDARARRCVQQIDEAAARAAELTRQMLAYAGESELDVQPLDLARVVQEMGELLKVSLPKKVRLEYFLDEPGPVVQGDAAQIRQVMMNLIINAGEAIGGAAGRVTVRCGSMTADAETLARAVVGGDLLCREFASLGVSDSGCGMDARTRSKIFDPFYTTKATGRGLGLASVLGVVRSHGGALLVDSAPGEGTSIRVLLPLAGEAAPAAVSPPSSAFHGKGTILVVDDESVSLEVTQRMLQRLGFEVVGASGGREAVARVREEGSTIDAVVLDLTMPDLSGEETLQELRKLRPRLPVLLYSGYSAHEAAGLCQPGLTTFLQKPFRLDLLGAALRELLDPTA